MRLALLLTMSTARAADSAAFLDQLDADDQGFSDAWEELEGALNAGPPGRVSVNRHADSIRRVWSQLKAKIGDGKATAAATCSQSKEGLRILRSKAELVLDLLGPMRGSGAELQAAAQLADPRLVFFALRAMASQKLPLPADAIELVAANDEVRALLHELLRKHKQVQQMPPAARTGEALARSKLVRWLQFPSELGCVPDEIILGKRIVRRKREYFVFRFRGKDRSWLAGASDGRKSFSGFYDWDQVTPEEHLDTMMDSLR